jgi:hypothetical protein
MYMKGGDSPKNQTKAEPINVILEPLERGIYEKRNF